MNRLDLSVLEDQSVALGTAVAKDGHTVKVQLKSLGELTGRVCKESDLDSCQMYVEKDAR